MEYKIVYVYTSISTFKSMVGALESKVKDRIEMGYKPLGGVSVVRYYYRNEECYLISQAMIKDGSDGLDDFISYVTKKK